MKQEIQITVEIPDHIHPGQFKRVFHLVKSCDDSVQFNFGSVLNGLLCLFYDLNAIITFKIL